MAQDAGNATLCLQNSSSVQCELILPINIQATPSSFFYSNNADHSTT